MYKSIILLQCLIVTLEGGCLLITQQKLAETDTRETYTTINPSDLSIKLIHTLIELAYIFPFTNTKDILTTDMNSEFCQSVGTNFHF